MRSGVAVDFGRFGGLLGLIYSVETLAQMIKNIYCASLERDFVFEKQKQKLHFFGGDAESEDSSFHPKGGSLTPKELTPL